MVEENMDELAEMLSNEHGKVFEDSKGSIIRGLETDTKWWWSDDAIPEVLAMDGFSIFDSPSKSTRAPYSSARLNLK